MTSLIAAAQMGDLDGVRARLHEVGGSDERGNTALMYAAREGHLEIAELLLPQEGRKVNPHGNTALMIAAQHGRTRLVELLIPREAQMQNRAGKTALMYAAENGHEDAVIALLPTEKCYANDQGKTALMYAAENGYELISSILANHEQGMRNYIGKAAVNYAQLGGHEMIVQILECGEHALMQNEGFTASIPHDSSDDYDDIRRPVAYTRDRRSSSTKGPFGADQVATQELLLETDDGELRRTTSCGRAPSTRQRAAMRDLARGVSPHAASRTRDSSVAIRAGPRDHSTTNTLVDFRQNDATQEVTDRRNSLQDRKKTGYDKATQQFIDNLVDINENPDLHLNVSMYASMQASEVSHQASQLGGLISMDQSSTTGGRSVPSALATLTYDTTLADYSSTGNSINYSITGGTVQGAGEPPIRQARVPVEDRGEGDKAPAWPPHINRKAPPPVPGVAHPASNTRDAQKNGGRKSFFEGMASDSGYEDVEFPREVVESPGPMTRGLARDEQARLATQYADGSWTGRTSQTGRALSPQQALATKYLDDPDRADRHMRPEEDTSSERASGSGQTLTAAEKIFVPHSPMADVVPLPAGWRKSSDRPSFDGVTTDEGSDIAPATGYVPIDAGCGAADAISSPFGNGRPTSGIMPRSLGENSLASEHGGSTAVNREESRKLSREIHELKAQIAKLREQIKTKERECETYRQQIGRSQNTQKIYADSCKLQEEEVEVVRQRLELKERELEQARDELTKRDQENEQLAAELVTVTEYLNELGEQTRLKGEEAASMQQSLRVASEAARNATGIDVRSPTSPQKQSLRLEIASVRRSITTLQDQAHARAKELAELKMRRQFNQYKMDEMTKLMQQLNEIAAKPKGPPIPPPGSRVLVMIPCAHMVVNPSSNFHWTENTRCPKCSLPISNLIEVEDV